MKTKSSFISIVLVLSQNYIYSQTQNSSDILPLNIGNKWIYTYVTDSYSSFTHFSSTESGLIEYKVIAKSVVSSNEIGWELRQKKNATRDTYGYPLQSVKDSLIFTIVESLAQNHEIYVSSNYNALSLFPFIPNSPDTSRFFRYKENLPGGDFFLRILYPDPSNPTLSRYKYEFKLRKDVGIMMLIFGHGYIGGGESSEYYLSKFNDQIISDVEKDNPIETNYKLYQNYPNPFNPSTIIKYSIPVVDAKFTSTAHVTLKVYDVLGSEVVTLVDENKQPGNYNVTFSVETFHGAPLPSGVYFYKLQCGSFNETKKLMLLK